MLRLDIFKRHTEESRAPFFHKSNDTLGEAFLMQVFHVIQFCQDADVSLTQKAEGGVNWLGQ